MSNTTDAFGEISSPGVNALSNLVIWSFPHAIASYLLQVAEEILELRKGNKGIQLECAIPFPGQADSWKGADQERRYKIHTATDESVITSEHYNRGCFFTRNRYMVDKADVVVCAFNGKSGGTAYTVDYALKQNKIVIQIDPETSSVSMLSKRNFESV